jgi:hypothetical protein
MIPAVLAAICFLACAFYLYVLAQGMPEKERKTTTRPAVDNEASARSKKKLAPAAGSRKSAEGQDCGKVRSPHGLGGAEPLRGRRPRCDECERIAYEKIAASFRLG